MDPSQGANPLLYSEGLSRFDRITPQHVTPALDVLLRDAESALERAGSVDVPAHYDTLSALLHTAVERLSRAWSTVGHLNQVCDTPALRAALNENLPRVSAFHTRLGADERLFAKYREIDADAQALDAPRRRALANALRDFVLAGAELRGAARARYMQCHDRLAELAQRFDEHVQDAVDAYALFVAADRLDGVPDDVRDALRADAQAEGHDGFKLGLQVPRWLPVMQYATDRALREQLYRAYQAQASDLGPAEHDNSALVVELLQLRQESARLLGFTDYAQLSLATKMARTPDEVLQFLRDLACRSRPQAERDLAEMRAFAHEQLGIAELQPWDLRFVAERLREQRFAFSEQEVKRYFTFERVLQGLFQLVETLFELRITPDTAPVWHDSVRLYRIERDGALVGQFYLDVFARTGKRPGAWMDDARGRWRRPDTGGAQTPVAHLVCNFAPPLAGHDALLTHQEVITLFHEFGHGLHHMLTRVDELAVAGLAGVEWDAVELPSQFMENFCWEWAVLSRLSAHVDDGRPLPRELFDKMVAARHFHSALEMLRQVEYALFDMRLHHEPDAATRVQAVHDEVRAEVAVLPGGPVQRLAHSFSHLFSGGYGAGYYSYKWAEVLSADAYSAFEESGLFDRDTGRRYRREILEVGGSRDALESFKAFRGREPSIAALLRHQGIA
ncbi:MAG: M3 family metallopeptidase [Ideonella sp.]|nr:M3 family metallopeptidase [Ideonella sp.]MCC7458672.1 M3 family metallopeptidase [Nitrospira sp.]